MLAGFSSRGLNLTSNIGSMIMRLTMRALGTLTGAIWGGLRALFSTAVRIVGGGFDLLKTLFRKAFDGIVALGKMVLVGFGAAIGATVVAVQKATEKIKQVGNELNDLRASSGLGIGAAGAVQRNFRAFGLTPDFGATNPVALQARTGAWGLPSVSDRNFIPQLASQYKNSDPMMARYMLDSLKLNNPQMTRTLLAPQSMIQGQLAFQNNVNAGLGVKPEVVSSLSQQVDFLTQKFVILKDAVLMKLAETALPRLLNIGEKIVNVLGNNSGKIGTFIETAVNKAFAALLRFGEFVIRLPEYFFNLGDSILSFVEAGLSAIPTLWDTFLSGIALVQSALEQLMQFGQAAFGALMNFGQTMAQLGPMIQPIFDGILNFLNVLGENPTIKRFLRAGKAVPGVVGTMADATGKAQDAMESGARGLGADENTASLISLVGTYFLGRGILGGAGSLTKWGLGKAGGWALGRLGLGAGAGAGGAGGGGAGAGLGLWARIMAGAQGVQTFAAGLPALAGTSLAGASAATIGGVTAIGAGIGTLAGYGFFRGTQALGMNKDKGFLQTLGHGTGQIRDWIMGTPGRTQADYNLWLQGQADMSKPVIKSPGVIDNVKKAVNAAASKAGQFASPASLASMMPSFNTNPANSTWATALDQKFGDRVREFSGDGMAQVAAMRARLNQAGAKYNADENIKLLRELLSEQKKQTKYAEQTAKGIGGVTDQVAGYALLRYAKESGMAMRRQT